MAWLIVKKSWVSDLRSHKPQEHEFHEQFEKR